MGALTSGDRLDNVEIEAYASGGDKGLQLVDEYLFHELYVNGVDTTGTANSVSFAFESFNRGHVDYGNDGKATTDVTGWDFEMDNVPDDLPVPTPDYLLIG